MEHQNGNLPITVDPETMGGVPVFRGTRVPVTTLFEYLERNYSIEDFLYCFPTVTKETAITVLVAAQQSTIERVTA